MTRRFLLTTLALLLVVASPAGAPGAAAADPSAFMSEMWKRAVEILGKKAPQTERLARFRELFQADFDGPGIARFVLGRYWRSASEEEQQDVDGRGAFAHGKVPFCTRSGRAVGAKPAEILPG